MSSLHSNSRGADAIENSLLLRFFTEPLLGNALIKYIRYIIIHI
jgi:hypothetical protein